MTGVQAGSQATPARGLVVTADDFGLHTSVNEAVERAHRDGILTAASLMAGAPAVRDAIARARAAPGLRVGLHLVLADGPSVLPRRAIPDLVDANGRFGTRMVRDGIRFFCLPRVRRQLALEIRAQFEAFAASGLPLDHVNAHKHFHLHPMILSLIIRIGREFGLRAVRLPRETGPPARAGTPRHPIPPPSAAWLRPWLALMAARLDAAGIARNDFVIGIRQSGRFDEPAMLAALHSLPAAGVGELYLHPALASGAAIAPSMRGYRHADEFAALVAPAVRAACAGLRAQGWRFGGYADLANLAELAVPSFDVRSASGARFNGVGVENTRAGAGASGAGAGVTDGGNLSGAGASGAAGGNLSGAGASGAAGGNVSGAGASGAAGGNLSGAGASGAAGGNVSGAGVDAGVGTGVSRVGVDAGAGGAIRIADHPHRGADVAPADTAAVPRKEPAEPTRRDPGRTATPTRHGP